MDCEHSKFLWVVFDFFFIFDIFAKICLTIKFNPKDFMIIYVKDSILYGASREGDSLLAIVNYLPFTPGEVN